MNAVRSNCFDASALVKLYVNETGSDIISNYFNNEPTKYTTPLCFYEALNVLKVKHFYRKEISSVEYHDATFNLTAWFSSIVNNIEDINFLTPSVFKNVQNISKKYSLDLSDAFQILSVKEGFFSKLSGDSRTILVSADKKLSEVAKLEGLRVWYFLDEPMP
jgi:predicted nucleic acid-binding protein